MQYYNCSTEEKQQSTTAVALWETGQPRGVSPLDRRLKCPLVVLWSVTGRVLYCRAATQWSPVPSLHTWSSFAASPLRRTSFPQSHKFRKIELIAIEENPQMWDILLVCCEEIKKAKKYSWINKLHYIHKRYVDTLELTECNPHMQTMLFLFWPGSVKNEGSVLHSIQSPILCRICHKISKICWHLEKGSFDSTIDLHVQHGRWLHQLRSDQC